MRIFERFRKRKEPVFLPEVPKKEEPKPEVESLKAKTDLLLTKFENLETRQEWIIEKLKNIEKILNELYSMAKS